MLPQQLGSSRTSLKHDHLLQAPDSFVRAPLPGMRKATAIVHTAPALGAGFTEYSVEMEPGGELGPAVGQRLIFVLSGQIDADRAELSPGGYVYAAERVVAKVETRLLVIEKKYKPMGDAKPTGFNGNVSAVAKQTLMGDEGVQVQTLVPDSIEFDFAVNLMTFAPGAALGMVETHVMEHGLLMLEGSGIYRLGDSWYPVMAGDFIWMAPYCPQWFGAIGKTPAKYLIYKNWNRHPL